ncbi:MAG: 6-phosphogluconolactonase [Pseudomonadaceae bacterium]
MFAFEQALQGRGVALHRFAGPAAQAGQLAADVAERLRAAIAERGRASLALSGGRSPIPFLQALASHVLDWECVKLTLVDERWVPASEPQSNAGLLQTHLGPLFGRVQWLPLYGGDSPQRDAELASAQLAAWLPLDVVVLGMGTDGHTASLFPGGGDLSRWLQADCDAVCVATVATDGAPRLTMTGRALHSARYRALAISGTAKLQVLRCAVTGAPGECWPIAAFLHAPMEIYYCPEDGPINDLTA